MSTVSVGTKQTLYAGANGPVDPQIPILLATDLRTEEPIVCMLLYSMHPTVLHEDSPFISADFPGAAKKYIKETICAPDTPVIYHTGPGVRGSISAVNKIRWFQEKAPEIWKRTRYIMTISDYLVFLLTGERKGDQGTASLLGL